MAETAGHGKEGRLKIVFFGTPHFAALVLGILSGWQGGELAAVFAQPDRESGRGKKIRRGECAALADELHIPVHQPASLKNDQALATIRELAPDIIVVAAYGLLIPGAILDVPKFGAINVHASLLPAYRGAAPIARAIMENWQDGAVTGVSIMRVVEALDAGPVYAKKEVAIGRHNHESLTEELAGVGGALLLETLESIAQGRAQCVPQDDALACYAKKLGREDGIMDWRKCAGEAEARIRGAFPWPCARTTLEISGKKDMEILLHEAKVGESCAGIDPGSLAIGKDCLKIACADRWLCVSRLCIPGKKPCAARDFVNGHMGHLGKPGNKANGEEKAGGPDSLCGRAR